MSTPVCEHPAVAGDLDVCLTRNQARKLKLGGKLGCGSFGCAFERRGRPDRVVKLTADEQDVANTLAAQGTGAAVRLFKAWRLAGARTAPAGDPRLQGSTTVWAMELERVEPLNGLSVPVGSRMGVTTAARIVTASTSPRERLEMARQATHCVERLVDPEARRTCAETTLAVVEGWNALKLRDVTMADMKASNYGRTADGRVVALDLGFSAGPRLRPDRIPALAGDRRRMRRLARRARRLA